MAKMRKRPLKTAWMEFYNQATELTGAAPSKL